VNWQKDDVTRSSFMLNPEKRRRLKKHLRPVECELAVAQMRGSLSGGCHRI
jgi:hypothetical protein